MDKSWMKLVVHSSGRLSAQYKAGVNSFISSAKRDEEGKMRCPCKKCMNAYRCRYDGKIVGGHLIAHGIMESYTNWYYHGEAIASSQPEDVGNVEMVNEDCDESREIGCRVRQDLTNFDYARWSSIPESDRAPITTSVKSKFVCLGAPQIVDKVINTKAARSARQYKHRWHVKWEKAVKEKGDAHARANPPQYCTPDQWTRLIDNVWTTEEFKAKSSKNKLNRSKQSMNHSCGSKSLASLAHYEMEKNEGQLDFPEFYKQTHYNAKKKKWSSPDCETKYNTMVNDVESQSSQVGSVSLTPEQMSRKHLGIRSGVLKGLGMRPSSSAPSTASSEQQRQIEEQQHQIEEQRRDLEEARREIEEHRRQMQEMFAWMATQGYQGPRPPPPPPPDGSAGCGIAA